MKLYLAPMEGVIDSVFREVLTSVGGIDQCVTEFFRVSDGQMIPEKVFYRECPELLNHSKTKYGVPVFVQILGGDPEPMAANALRAVQLGACGIDVNFGCPAKTVNKNDGGATLLKYPYRIQKILETIRKTVPAQIPVTAKIRLGFDNPEMCIENAQAVQAAGINTLTVHCRTKTDMYKPPAFWEWIPKIKDKTNLNIVANGDIWNNRDFERCREITGCDHFMIGRGAIANPFIFMQIKNAELDRGWESIRPLLPIFFDFSARLKSGFFAQARTKQWLSMMSKTNEDSRQLFETLKVIRNPVEFREMLN
jgi:tRNA-dihydrouridine synthase C